MTTLVWQYVVFPIPKTVRSTVCVKTLCHRINMGHLYWPHHSFINYAAIKNTWVSKYSLLRCLIVITASLRFQLMVLILCSNLLIVSWSDRWCVESVLFSEKRKKPQLPTIIYDIKLLRFLFLAKALFTASESDLCRLSRPLKVSVNLVVPSLLKKVVFSTYIAVKSTWNF